MRTTALAHRIRINMVYKCTDANINEMKLNENSELNIVELRRVI